MLVVGSMELIVTSKAGRILYIQRGVQNRQME